MDKSVNDLLIFFPPKLRSNWSNIDQLDFKKNTSSSCYDCRPERVHRMRNSYKEIDLIELEDLYENLKSKGFSLDLTRGKPHEDQLDLSRSLNDPLDSFLYQGKDVRNYGELMGLSGCREIGSQLLDFPTDNIVAGNNSSLLYYL